MPYDFKLRRIKDRAMGMVSNAVRQGRLTRPSTCSLCDAPAKTISYTFAYGSVTKSSIVAHHWKGYEDEVATDVLWICHSCNTILDGPEYHNGSLGVSELKQIVSDYRAKRSRK